MSFKIKTFYKWLTIYFSKVTVYLNIVCLLKVKQSQVQIVAIESRLESSTCFLRYNGRCESYDN